MRHVMEDLGSVCPNGQILDLPVPQMVDDVTDALRILDFPIAEQAIEVPKFSCSPCPSRSPIPEPQTAEQLVEVPTVLSPTRIALRIAEQIVDTPVPQGRGKRRGQGFLPEQSSTATSSSGKRISERTVEQIVDISSSGGGLGQGSSSSAGPADEDVTGFFRTFHHGKRAECRAGSECAAGWARQLIHAERSSNASCRRHFALGLSGVGAVLRHGWPLLLEQAHVRPLGSHRRASMSSGSGRWTRRRTSITGTKNTCQYICPSSSSWVTGYGVRGLASPHPFLGATALAVEARVVLAMVGFFRLLVANVVCERACSLWSSLLLSGERGRCASCSGYGRPCDHTAYVPAVL